MKADPSRQLRLLDLQALDTRLGQLKHQAKTLPEHAAVTAAEAEVATLTSEEIKVRTALEDVQRDVARADADVQVVRDRADRNQARLDAGTGSAKDLQALQHELESLGKRQSDLEDIELEVMERAENLEAELSVISGKLSTARADLESATSARGARLAQIQAEATEVAAPRAQLASEVGEDLLALYEKIRTSTGLGAGGLVARRCDACRLDLNAVDLGRIRSAPQDEVLRCEECRRILVRTEASGL